MASITVSARPIEQPEGFASRALSFYRRALLGAAAGGIGGMLAGGVGGRLAMFLLRVTSPDYLSGVDSDDGFEIGVVSLATLNLIATTAFLGSLAGIFVALALTYMPWAWAPSAWVIPGATIGGAALIHGDGVDFTPVQPHWLAIALFVLVPALGLACVAHFIRLWEGWWWIDRRRTALAAATGAWPLVVLFPLGLAVVAAGAAWAALSQNEAVRSLPRTVLAQRAAAAVFAAISLAFLPVLIHDLLDVL
ncbi:MAG: hypothetical protein U0837_15810 [Dehalococcoidia bacterium]